METLPSISTAVQRIRSGNLQPIELVEFCLGRIQRYDEQIRAWVEVAASTARREAERLENLARAGRMLGPLHGIPIGIKDIIDVAGLPTRAGSPLRKAHVATRDALLVDQLRRAGAIILGKTVTTEWACFDPPPTRNPWNANHTPGGSSSGSAAAVAMEMCLAAIGSQTGGSIVRPASYCGVAGLKPTFGAVSTDGVVPVSPHLDHVGPIARSVDDLASVFIAIDSSRQTTRLHEFDALQPVLDTQRQVACDELPDLYVIEEFFMQQADPDMLAAVRPALDRLGPDATRTAPPLPESFGDVHTMHRCIMAVEAAAVHREMYLMQPDAFRANVASLIEEGLSIPAADYQAALEHQTQFRRHMSEWFADGRIAVTPAANTPAPGRLDTTGDPRFQSPWSYAGLPTVSIPCGLTSGGLPCALQLIGAEHNEPSLFRTADWCARRLGFIHRPRAV